MTTLTTLHDSHGRNNPGAYLVRLRARSARLRNRRLAARLFALAAAFFGLVR